MSFLKHKMPEFASRRFVITVLGLASMLYQPSIAEWVTILCVVGILGFAGAEILLARFGVKPTKEIKKDGE